MRSSGPGPLEGRGTSNPYARRSSRRLVVGLLVAVSSLAAGRAVHAQPGDGALEGVVVDPSGGVLPGVTVTLGEAPDALVQVTDAAGAFRFDGLRPGLYTLVASLPGFEAARDEAVAVAAGGTTTRRLVLKLATVSEDVVVVANADEPLTAPEAAAGRANVSKRTLAAVPLATERFEDALPLLPGTVRGPDGLLNMNGARASQSALLMNGMNVTDPVTGQFAVRLPLEAVETLNVHTSVYSARFGSATGGITNVITRPGQDRWDLQVQNFMPRIRFKEGTVRGFDAFTPRVRLAGPIRRSRLWFSHTLNYRFQRDRVNELRPLSRSEQIRETFDSLTQLDAAFGRAHRATFTFAWFPGNIDNLRLDTLHPFDATPDFLQRGWSAAISDTAVLNPRTTLTTSFAVKEFDVTILPKTREMSEVTPTGFRANYFNHLDRDSRRYDFASTLTTERDHRSGKHLLTLGGEVSHAAYAGLDASLPVEVIRSDGSLARRIDFLGSARVGATNDQVALFLEDQWSLASRLTFHLGTRYAYQAITGEHTAAPRLQVSFRPFASDRTVIKSGYGRFYDKLPLNARDFARHQRRRETFFGPDGLTQAATSMIEFENRIAPGGLQTPRSDTWSLEVNQLLTETLLMRVGYRSRRGSHELVIDPLGDRATMLLSNRGRSRSTEVELTVQRRLAHQGELNFSYVRARTTGNLNDFVSILGDNRDPIIQPDEFSRQPFDVPNRFLAWGVIHLPGTVTISPTVEYRNGFPFTLLDDEQRVVGSRNRGGRFRNLLTLDLVATKEVRLTKRYRARVGIQVFNLGGHFNPRDVQNNLASPRFGEFANSVDQQIRMKFVLLF